MTLRVPDNLFDNIPDFLAEELFTDLAGNRNVTIRRIVSTGQASPELEDEGVIEMQTGSYLNIPAHKRHRVLWTSPVTETVWLAVHYD